VKAFRLLFARWARYVVLWFVILLPISPSIWRLYAMGPTCFTPAWTAQGVDPGSCLAGFAVLAPFAVIFGPIGHDEEDPTSEILEVLLTAFVLAAVVTAPTAIITSWKRKTP
jgi:hypothetical protein